MVVTQRTPVKDLDHAVDSDVGAGEGVIASQTHRQVVGVRYIPDDGQCPDCKFINAVVLIIADD